MLRGGSGKNLIFSQELIESRRKHHERNQGTGIEVRVRLE